MAALKGCSAWEMEAVNVASGGSSQNLKKGRAEVEKSAVVVRGENKAGRCDDGG